jgi:tRNA (guanine37-N1)-methyltransferase
LRIDILTLFPEMFDGVLSASMLGRAQANGLIDIRVHNIRDYTDNKHKKADDYPFGGGAGLVMMAQPIYDCMETFRGRHSAPHPSNTARTLLKPKRSKRTFRGRTPRVLCGHYEA